MSGKIVIIDPVSTNRIVLRVKMLAAQYEVRALEQLQEAQACIAQQRPDLILINLSALGREGVELCKTLRADPQTRCIAQVCVGAELSHRARLAALSAGLDDVLPAPVNDALLMARVRNLLRQRSALSDLIDKDGDAARHFGFGEARDVFGAAETVAVLPNDKLRGHAIVTGLRAHLGHNVRSARSIRDLANGVPADVIVLSGGESRHNVVGLSEMISDLRARATTSQSAQLVIVPRWAAHQAAMALDLSADDVAFDDTSAEELALRIRRLAARKGQADALRAELKEGLRAAITDTLTGLHNRHYADSYMKRLQNSARTSGEGYAMILLDIDHFKAINDQHGHAVGDKVLTEVAHRLHEVAGASDLCARIGGEEFLIVLSRTSMTRARLVAEKLRRAIAGQPFALDQGDLAVTVSAGVAVFDPLSEAKAAGAGPLGPLYEQADAALYHAKSAGRDVVSCAQTAAA